MAQNKEHMIYQINEATIYGHIPINAVYDPTTRLLFQEEQPLPISAVIRNGQTRYYSQETPVMQHEYQTSPEFYCRVG